jgi:hypothetical protein
MVRRAKVAGRRIVDRRPHHFHPINARSVHPTKFDEIGIHLDAQVPAFAGHEMFN